jgi:hypothetical protein
LDASGFIDLLGTPSPSFISFSWLSSFPSSMFQLGCVLSIWKITPMGMLHFPQQLVHRSSRSLDVLHHHCDLLPISPSGLYAL